MLTYYRHSEGVILKNQRRVLTENEIYKMETPQRMRGNVLLGTWPDLFRHPHLKHFTSVNGRAPPKEFPVDRY